MLQIDDTPAAWNRMVQRAFALHVGIPEERLKAAVPGFKWHTQPVALQPLLSGDPAALPDLISLLNDRRATHMNSGLDATHVPVSDLAQGLADLLVPSGRPPKDVIQGVKEWASQSAKLQPEQRLQPWFNSASDSQRRAAFPYFLFTDHAPAWPLIEKWLLSLEDFNMSWFLSSAYVRHRREQAAPFLAQLKQKWAPLDEEKTEEIWYNVFVVRNGRSLLVEPFTARQRMEQYLEGALTLQDLQEWAIRCIDLPWDYHSSQIEPASMHLSVLDDTLLAALQVALTTSELSGRYRLVKFAESLSSNRSDVIAHSERDELPSAANPKPGDPSQKTLTGCLRGLLADKREVADNFEIVSPAHAAAQIVWRRWGTNTRGLDTVFHGVKPDWRGLALGFPHKSRQLAIDAALELLDDPTPMKPEPFPKTEATRLCASFTDGSTADWRKRMNALKWDQRLMIAESTRDDEVFSARLWPHMIEWMEFADAEHAPMQARKIWKELCEGKVLNLASCTALRDWVRDEAAAGRYWTVVAESFPHEPGLTLHVIATPLEKRTEPFSTEFRFSLDGTSGHGLFDQQHFKDGKWASTYEHFSEAELTSVLNNMPAAVPLSYEGKPWVRELKVTIGGFQKFEENF